MYSNWYCQKDDNLKTQKINNSPLSDWLSLSNTKAHIQNIHNYPSISAIFKGTSFLKRELLLKLICEVTHHQYSFRFKTKLRNIISSAQNCTVISAICMGLIKVLLHTLEPLQFGYWTRVVFNVFAWQKQTLYFLNEIFYFYFDLFSFICIKLQLMTLWYWADDLSLIIVFFLKVQQPSAKRKTNKFNKYLLFAKQLFLETVKQNLTWIATN